MNEDQLRQAFLDQSPALQAWGSLILDTINERVSAILPPDRKIDDFFKIPPTSRIKNVESFLTKALRRSKGYSDPLNDITDKVGVRFVVLVLREIDLVGDLLKQIPDWDVELSRDFMDERLRNPHHFDYQSQHYIVRPRNDVSYRNIPIPANTPCEVQIRTLLQHAYSELSHDTIYKPRQIAVEPSISREVAKSMALIETTDSIFQKVMDDIVLANKPFLKLIQDLEEVYSSNVGRQPQTDQKLNILILDSVCDPKSINVIQDVKDALIEKPYISKRIKERISTLYFQPVVLLLYTWALNKPDELVRSWPLDQLLLRDIYSDLGISFTEVSL